MNWKWGAGSQPVDIPFVSIGVINNGKKVAEIDI